ncbi:hypothetical protein I302_103022 [Kwoniella bestiolae CBS 10118]|uniref:Ricin B lectin domain-containing protein n=1 Tax=Kwoniella bestiolae CBS 10118 TaxID=1296100 RepID=A0A1B9GGK9_9TREE|nr:hypothetical protein I302_01718 [Kwoniella bestiolae CBS 10118]OCF30199.1 hypothetical protein I302_01718 [Kwoniella bestiolae CBS 10118]
MFKQLTILASALLPLALGAPLELQTTQVEKRSTPLQCVQYQYGGPFTSTGFNGFIHLYSNITQFDSETQTTSFNESRLGSSEDGTIQPCGDCRTTELFGFEICQTRDRLAFDGLQNSATSFYGHLTYYNVGDFKCLTASSTDNGFEGSALTLQDCQYDYEDAAASGQYFEMHIADAGYWYAHLVDKDTVYGPTPELNINGSLVLYDVIGANKTFTYFGFKAQEF